jgi:hypothetical protein
MYLICKSSAFKLADGSRVESSLKPFILNGFETHHTGRTATSNPPPLRSFENTLVYGISWIARIDTSSASGFLHQGKKLKWSTFPIGTSD